MKNGNVKKNTKTPEQIKEDQEISAKNAAAKQQTSSETTAKQQKRQQTQHQ
jgi:hypothetical protein